MSNVRDGGMPSEEDDRDYNDNEMPPSPPRAPPSDAQAVGASPSQPSNGTPPRSSTLTQNNAPPRPSTDRHTCVMIGPADSGKTTLLAAIKRACEQEAEDDMNLGFVAEPETARLISLALGRMARRETGRRSTNEVQNYPFEINLTAKAPNFWSPPIRVKLSVTMNDSPGGAVFPTEDRTDLSDKRNSVIAQAKTATSMILCVDITRPSVLTLQQQLPLAFAEIVEKHPVSTPIHFKEMLWNKLRGRFGGSTQDGHAFFEPLCLNVDRFLLMLTQVDKLCYQLPHSIKQTVRIAEIIDPVEQARSLFGPELLKMIRNVLKPDADFAVSVTSAFGFHPLTGNSFADFDGRASPLSTDSGEDILRRWTPYGIRNAIYFLATGRARGTVKRLLPGDFKPGPEPIDFTYSNDS
jgi:hypothetical protein